ncbi:GNAT superfamily N-acetyltransferase [Deinobacterium chartae]|uniref:GNAT superfamily N-acetyltransferase n=1 Tax=Deinobacterium chartae TaxID=521158 RepID=A0A841I328_9DEIO|nr:hypothetical protein [Deinobacterium chartae]MBB6099456.1 GNAT superfamily N-acetyltransferase [Deinobacterium chartae]
MSTHSTPDPALTPLLETALSALPAPLRVWYSPSELVAQLGRDLKLELSRLSDDVFAERFWARCAAPGTTPDDYRNRWLDLDGLRVLTGIRFKGLDMAQPFVDVVASTAPLEAPDLWQALAARIRSEYAVFRPLQLRVFRAGPAPLELAPGLPVVAHTRLVAGLLSAMRSLPDPAHFARLEAHPASNLNFYPRYRAIYDALHAESPERREFARPESEEDLQEALEDGLLFEMRIEGVWAGVMAAYRGVGHGLRGFVVGEMLLDSAFRGQGLGPAAQRCFAHALPARPGDTVFGHIHPRNVAALTTARRCGRQDLGGELFVRL